MRENSSATFSFISTTSLNTCAISPSMPIRSVGRRTEKSPFLNARNALKSPLRSSASWMNCMSVMIDASHARALALSESAIMTDMQFIQDALDRKGS